MKLTIGSVSIELAQGDRGANYRYESDVTLNVAGQNVTFPDPGTVRAMGQFLQTCANIMETERRRGR